MKTNRRPQWNCIVPSRVLGPRDYWMGLLAYFWLRHFKGCDESGWEEMFSALGRTQTKFIAINVKSTGSVNAFRKPFLVSLAFATDTVKKKGYAYNLEWDAKQADKLFNAVLPCMKSVQCVVFWNMKQNLHAIENGGVRIDFTALGETMPVDAQSLKRLVDDATEGFDLAASVQRHFGKHVLNCAKELNKVFAGIKNKIAKFYSVALEPFGQSLGEAIETPRNGDGEAKRIVSAYESEIDSIEKTAFEKSPYLYGYNAVQETILTAELFLVYFYRYRELYGDDMAILRQEQDANLMLFGIERHGLALDAAKLSELIRKNDCDALAKFVRERTGFEPTRNRDLMEWFGRNASGGGQNEPKRFRNLDENSLAAIAESNEGVVRDVAEALLEWRKSDKRRTMHRKLLTQAYRRKKVYAEINSHGAKTGRVSSNIQQFPNDGTRAAFVPDFENGYVKIAYFDFSQMELRMAAEYTLEYGYPDKHLLRAFVPYGCVDRDGAGFTFRDKGWKTKEWFDENGRPWEPTDLHALTAINAFGEGIKSLPPEEFKKYRDAAKAANFCLNYGGGINALLANPMSKGKTKDWCERLLAAYKTTYANLDKTFKAICGIASNKKRVTNLFGRKYFLAHWRESWKAPNWLIQGSCADYVKRVGIKIDGFLKRNGFKSRLINQLHDEYQIEIHATDPPDAIERIKNEIDRFSDEFFNVPFVCEVGVTDTNWAEKRPWAPN